MSMRICFDVSDEDIVRFRSMMNKAHGAVESLDPDKIVSKVLQDLDAARRQDPPDFIAERLEKVAVLARMVTDDEWKLPDEERRRVLSTVAYFCDPADLIDDRIPALGFLDDAILIDLVAEDFKHEIEAYEEFCSYRTAEEERRAKEGAEEASVHKDDWLTDKRAALHLRMRQRRGDSSSGWSSVLW